MGAEQSTPTEFPTSLHFQHALARALYKGTEPSDSTSGQGNSSSRPGLPTELVILILRYAEVFKPYRVEPGWSVQNQTRIAQAFGADIARAIVLITPPVDRVWLRKTAALQLVTFSKDQGWCGDPKQGSWSWFEVGIVEASAEGLANEEVEEQVTEEVAEQVTEEVQEQFTEETAPETFDDEEDAHSYITAWDMETESPPQVRARLDPDTGEELRWSSHHNKIAGKDYELYVGQQFGPDHEIWSKIQEGDRLGVWMCAQFSGWSCKAKEAEIRTSDWFEPTLL